APGHNQLGESAVAAADIDPFQARAWRQPVKKDLAGNPAPGAHHPLISGAILEADLVFGHRMITLVRSRSKPNPRARRFAGCPLVTPMYARSPARRPPWLARRGEAQGLARSRRGRACLPPLLRRN